MIRVSKDNNTEEVKRAIKVLEEEKSKDNGTYNKEEVLEALKLVFHKKCYICENNNITSYEIEHLRSHRGNNKELKFDWDNLLLSCGHCNNIKRQLYDDILDCTKIDVDEVISFRKNGNFAWQEDIEIKALDENYSTNKTVELLDKVYNGTTSMKKLESSNIRKQLRSELAKFMSFLDEYYLESGDIKEDARIAIQRQLKQSSPFAAFKRWIVRDNKEVLKEFLQEDGMKIK